MWFNNSKDNEVTRRSNWIFKILNEYENIDMDILLFYSRKRLELEDMR